MSVVPHSGITAINSNMYNYIVLVAGHGTLCRTCGSVYRYAQSECHSQRGCLDFSCVDGTVIITVPSTQEKSRQPLGVKNFLLIFLCALCSWGVLNIASGEGNTSYSDQTIMFAAGYLEGALTAR